MKAIYAARASMEDPISALEVGELATPVIPEGWVRVRIKSASLNHHDLWSLKGVGLPSDRLPMILGCDGAGVTDDGREVLLHSVINDPSWTGAETLDPKRSLLSEKFPGTLSEFVYVPAQNLLPKPAFLSWDEAGSLSTAWLTAFSMLKKAALTAGEKVLIQGSGGGLSTALILLAKAQGLVVWVTSRSADKRARATSLGADGVFESGERLPDRVDAVMESVGAATWQHSVRALRPGGTIVISGATSGDASPAELTRIFFLQLRVLGSTMGSISEFREMLDLMESKKITPVIDSTYDFADAPKAFARMNDGELFGKVVIQFSS
ncbi:MAG: Zn-dependent oxidoreductase [Actinobacteria bacterium]|nr:MAG: Zn-dependent oxidoreductase [Actinomycetota bacterium]